MSKAKKVHADKSKRNHSEKFQFAKFVKKSWNYIWNDDSLGSWILNVILAFVIIKFVIYPVLGFAMGTSLPVVAVISGSMEHEGNFDDWWQSNAECEFMICSQSEYYKNVNISKDNFLNFPLKNGFNKGDIILLRGVKSDNVEIGDVLVFNANMVYAENKNSYPIIHRVIEVNEEDGKYTYVTKGDHNRMSIVNSGLDEFDVRSESIVGKGFLRVPYVGYVKIGFVNLLSSMGLI